MSGLRGRLEAYGSAACRYGMARTDDEETAATADAVAIRDAIVADFDRPGEEWRLLSDPPEHGARCDVWFGIASPEPHSRSVWEGEWTGSGWDDPPEERGTHWLPRPGRPAPPESA